jgi:hypothetical protein
MNKLEIVITNVGKDILHGVEYPVEFLVKAEKAIASAIQDQPEIKTAVLSLVKQAQTVLAESVVVVSGKGIGLASEAKALADAEAFFGYFKSIFIPLVEQVFYSEVSADLK